MTSFAAAGHELALVGGPVRDAFLDRGEVDDGLLFLGHSGYEKRGGGISSWGYHSKQRRDGIKKEKGEGRSRRRGSLGWVQTKLVVRGRGGRRRAAGGRGRWVLIWLSRRTGENKQGRAGSASQGGRTGGGAGGAERTRSPNRELLAGGGMGSVREREREGSQARPAIHPSTICESRYVRSSSPCWPSGSSSQQPAASNGQQRRRRGVRVLTVCDARAGHARPGQAKPGQGSHHLDPLHSFIHPIPIPCGQTIHQRGVGQRGRLAATVARP